MSMNTSEIIDMFTQRPIPPGQINLYKVLYLENKSLSLQEIADEMRDGDVESLSMLLIALCNRITDQESGWKRDDILRDIFHVMLPNSDKTSYRMRFEMRQAINQCPELHKIIKSKTVQQIYEDYGRFPSDKSKFLTVSF